MHRQLQSSKELVTLLVFAFDFKNYLIVSINRCSTCIHVLAMKCQYLYKNALSLTQAPVLIHLRRNCCNCRKHNYHYHMSRADFIRSKNHVNISGKNHEAYADAALSRILSTAILSWYAVLKHWACAEFTLGVHRVCQIEFTQQVLQ